MSDAYDHLRGRVLPMLAGISIVAALCARAVALDTAPARIASDVAWVAVSVTFYLALIALGLVYAQWQGLGPRALFGRLEVRSLCLGVLVAVFVLLAEVGLLFTSIGLLANLFEEPLRKWLEEPSRSMELLNASQPPALVLLNATAFALLAPLGEELCFRGVLFPRWSRKWGFVRGMLFSSLLFGILHLGLFPPGAFAFGVISCLLYVRTRSLWPSIALHVVNNGTVGLLVYLDSLSNQKEEAITVEMMRSLTLPGVVLFVVALPPLIWFLRRHWPKKGEVYPVPAHEPALEGRLARGD